ncbi:MAG: KamA family protein [Deltaproteobacteria bacterium]|nr:KamA family protein [Deltaproteobacteria bacterium]
MTASDQLAKVAINPKSHALLHQVLGENPRLFQIMSQSESPDVALRKIREWAMTELAEHDHAVRFYKKENGWRELYGHLTWKDFATIRILDYVDNADREFVDQNQNNSVTVSNPFKMLWLATNCGTGGARPDFFVDMLELFRQFSKKRERELPTRETVLGWLERHPCGLDDEVLALREENRKRIINVIIDWIDSGEKNDSKYYFEAGQSREEKFAQVTRWWDESLFHLRFAARTPSMLNQMLGESLDPDTVELLERAKARGIPFFVNPHYVSLLNVHAPDFAIASDLAIRDYVIYSSQLVEAFGSIVAWEKEDKIEEGKPNAAGWLLPGGGNVHRRYPDSAILIPNTKGRACGGLCTACQRMYNFQKGQTSFNFENLAPRKSWREKLVELMGYFENDSSLRDILITGGDALMSTDASLQRIFDAVTDMAIRKKEANRGRKDGEKFAEMTRVRLGTRLLSYLPQRVTPALCEILGNFRHKALKIGITQFTVQTHFESAMEITPECRRAISMLQHAGWLVVNQHVLTTASSRRGHASKLRRELVKLGVLPYYTFSVKGFKENHQLFSTAARIMQELTEEKCLGEIGRNAAEKIAEIIKQPSAAAQLLKSILEDGNQPFLSTDRNICNLPGVGKSLSFRVVGINRYGHRILEFEYDDSRKHSPIIQKLGRITFIESKSITEYLNQMSEMGDDPHEYRDLYGYSVGATEPRFAVFEYPDYDFRTTEEMTNLSLKE